MSLFWWLISFILLCSGEDFFLRPCTDLRPIDILLKSLRSDMNHSNNLKRSFDSESQVFAYRLTHAQSTLSFSADKIFTKCTFFPEEFSFFITFKYEPDNLSSTGSSRNSQCIFSLRHPTKKVTLIALEINNNHFVLTYNNTRKNFLMCASQNRNGTVLV